MGWIVQRVTVEDILVGKMSKKIYKLIKDEIFNFDKFVSSKIIFIDRTSGSILDHRANSKFSYDCWINKAKTCTTIKVEGLESNKKLLKYFSKYQIRDIHLFFSPKSSYSFGWHKDNVTVFLYVIKGKKIVNLKSKKHVLREGQGVIIPRGHLHKVFSDKNTWALSLGLK